MYSSFTGKSCRQLVAEHANADDIEREAVRIAEERRAAADSIALDDVDLLVTVTEGDLESLVDQGTVVVFTGTDEHQRIVTFAVDHRPAQDIVDIIRGAGELVVGIESWQVIRTTSPITV
jgi:hypothetical protein